MSYYVDGFVVPVPRRNLETYRAIARTASEVWKEHGAIAYWEGAADDVKPGKVTSFPQAVQLKDDETVVFAFIVYPSRAVRDEANRKAMEDPRLKAMVDPKALPFDGMRMFWGGFDELVRA